MEVLEKENAKEAAKGAVEGSQELTLNDVYLLNKAVEELIQASPAIKIHIASRLFETKGNLENIVMEFDKKQQDILKKHVKIGKDGKLMTKTGSGGKQEWDYKRKKDKDLAEKEMNKMFNEKTVFVKLEKFAETEIANLEINPFKPQQVFMPGQQQAPEVTKVHFILDLFYKYLIIE